jgi:hypothetical protein
LHKTEIKFEQNETDCWAQMLRKKQPPISCRLEQNLTLTAKFEKKKFLF